MKFLDLRSRLTRGGDARSDLRTRPRDGRRVRPTLESMEARQLLTLSPIQVEYLWTALETDAFGANVQRILGPATSGEVSVPGVPGAVMQMYQGGAIYSATGIGAHVVYGDILAKFNALGGPLGSGLPTTDEQNTFGAPGGRVSHFQRADIYWSGATGSHVVYGGILAKFSNVGGTARLGLPTTDEMTTPDQAGRYNHFLTIGPYGGSVAAIDWLPGSGAHLVEGPIAAKFAQMGWEASGEVLTDTISIIDGVNRSRSGDYNRFGRMQPLPFGLPPVQLSSFAIDYTGKGEATYSPGPSYTDVKQGGGDTCWIDASIAALAQHSIDISRRIEYLGANAYAVNLFNFDDPANRRTNTRMHRDRVIVYFDGESLDADLGFDASRPSQSWALVMQRAVIQAVAEWDHSQSIASPHSGTGDDPLAILTGSPSQLVGAGSQGLESTITAALAAGKNVTVSTLPTGTATLAAWHYYHVVRATSSELVLYNPWGTSATVKWDVIRRDTTTFYLD